MPSSSRGGARMRIALLSACAFLAASASAHAAVPSMKITGSLRGAGGMTLLALTPSGAAVQQSGTDYLISSDWLLRTGARTAEWSAVISATFLTTELNRSEVVDFMKIAGATRGIGDWRPKYGRFEVLTD